MFQSYLRSIQEIPVTLGLIVIHSVLYLLLMNADPSFASLWMVSDGSETLKQFGAQYNPAVWEGEYYRLFFCAFLHGNLVHLILNNLGLYVLGRLVERLLGSKYFFMLYLISLYGGSVASLLWTSPLAVSVGASGAIYGIAGALMIFLIFDLEGDFVMTSAGGRLFFFVLIAFNFALGEWFEVINDTAHIGGFVAGAAFTVFFWSRIPGRSFPNWLGQAVLLALIFVLGGITYRGLHPEKGGMWQLYKGAKAFEAGDAKGAKEHLLLASKQKKGDKHTLDLLGRVYVQTEAWREAAGVYAKLTKLSPSRWSYWLQRLTALAEAGDKVGTKELMKTIRKRFKSEFRNETFRALFLAAAQEVRPAIQIYQQLLEEHPKDANLNNNLSWLLLTAHDKKYRNVPMALSYAKMAVRQSHGKIAAYLDTLARAYFELGDIKRAIETEEKALSAYDARSQILHLKRQLRMFQKAFARKAKKAGAVTKPATRPVKARPTTKKATQ